MSFRRGGGDDGALRLKRSVTPLSTSRKLPSLSQNPQTKPSSSVLKENSNPRRSTSRGSASNPTLKPVTRSAPRGRSSSPSEFQHSRRISVDRVPKDPNPIRPKPTQKAASTHSSERVKPFTTRSSFEAKTTSEQKTTTINSNSSKYSSRLHEKLAFLEGKVKRIASDIKKTKEMLDMNNPDASKAILSDIQDKISGIEKAMVHVVPNEDKKSKQADVVVVVDDDGVQTEQGKSLVKGINSEELEARLFPHQRLLRDRTVMKDSVVKVVEKVLSPVEENSIELEFLASIDKETSKERVSACEKVKEMEGGSSSEIGVDGSMNSHMGDNDDILLESDEKLEEFDDQENKQGGFVGEEINEDFKFKLNEIGNKNVTGGWFVYDGEAAILAHHDASCSFYDITNCEEKAVYMPPPGVSPNIWRDCWIIRAPGSDGCSGKFVVAASAGNTMDSGFCSWDFYTKEVRAFQIETGTSTSRTALRPLPNNIVQRRNSASGIPAAEAKQWWYRPCGPLMISTASSQRGVKVFDVRDGEQIMKWDVSKPVLAMEYSSPLQWRNRGKIVVAEAESVSLWDVNSLTPQALLSVPSGGTKISALHVSNTDAELGGGVRKRVSSSEAEGNDGVFCSSDSINVMDFRQPSGVGLRIPKSGVNVHSVFSRGDSVFLGCTTTSSMGKRQSSPLVQQFSLRNQGLFSTYTLPESNAHLHHAAISQVWGNSDFVMGVCGLGLYVFDALKDDPLRVVNMDFSSTQSNQRFREVVGPDDLYLPSFDYLGSRVLLISRDRPAVWRHLIA